MGQQIHIGRLQLGCLRVRSSASCIFVACLFGAVAGASRGEIILILLLSPSPPSGVFISPLSLFSIISCCAGCFPALLSEHPKKQPGNSTGNSNTTDELTHGSFTLIRLVAKIVGSTLMAVISNSYASLPYPFAFPAIGFAAQAAAMILCSAFCLLLIAGAPTPQRSKGP